MFRDVCIGWPGSVHNARVLANSALFNKANQRIIMAGNEIRVNGTDMPIFIVSDSAYPLCD